MKVITHYTEDNRHFVIVQNEKGYWGIEDIYLKDDGTLKREINGIEGYLSDSLSQCLTKIHQSVQFKKRVSEGEDPMRVALELAYEAKGVQG